MRILYLTNGQTPHDLRFAKALAQTQHQVFVLSLAGIFTGWPENISPVPWEPSRRNWLRIQLQAPKLKSVIRNLQPDIVHAGPVQGPAFLAAVSQVHPLVTMSWGSDLLLDAERNLQSKRITRFTLSNTDVLVGDSKCILDQAVKFGYIGPYFQFPWGVDLAHFSPHGASSLRGQLGWQDETVFLSMRSFESLYDVDCIVQAFCSAAHTRPDLRLLVFGQGSREVILRKKINDAGLSERVYFGGIANLKGLPDVYKSADLYLSATHTDGASVSLMEALACGLPALVSDIPGNREWITPEGNGWLFKTGSVEQLSERMLAFHRNSTEVKTMKSMNRKLAEERADWSKNFPVLLEAYEKAIEIHGGCK